MKRRDLIKTGLLGLSASAIALSGCNKKDNYTSDILKIKPKQTGIYEFSCPLPFNYKTIDEIVELNKTLKKSQVTSFYNNAPNWNHNNWVSIKRAKNDFIKTYDEFFKYVNYAQEKGFKVSYLMNSPKPFSENDINTFEDEFKLLLELLAKNNCLDIKIANLEVVRLISKFMPNKFNIHASTAFEYTLVSQYDYLNDITPNLTLIDVTNGENQNFKLLSALRKKFPKIKLELMVNEGCAKGCPVRIACISENFSVCGYYIKKTNILNYFLKTGIILPWNLEYYSALGINNFKFIASSGNDNTRNNFHDISGLKSYLECVENGVDNITIGDFFAKTFGKMVRYASKINKNVKLSTIKPLFPNIRYFIAHGHECATRCGVDCNYCYECAKNIEKVLLS